MTSQPKPFNLRMLTTDQIRKLSDHGLKRYRSKVLLIRFSVHAQQEAGEGWAEANKSQIPWRTSGTSTRSPETYIGR